MDYKQKFIEYYQANIHREGADRLLEWLQTTDFFTAPASTRYHCACPSGLVQHSVNVYEVMMEKHFDPETDSAESFALCALLHDVYGRYSTFNLIDAHLSCLLLITIGS